MMIIETIRQLEDVLWQSCAIVLKDIIAEPDKFIRWKHPTNGVPDWTVDDNILFLNLNERDEPYSQQRNYKERVVDGTVIRYAMRTRTWDLSCTAYGQAAHDITNALKDGFFTPEVEMILYKKDVALVPYLPRCQQINEVFAGKWWERWDITLTFNEKYVHQEDVGHIEELPFGVFINR